MIRSASALSRKLFGAGEEKREPIRRIRAGEDLPGARIRARQVLWIGDRAALEAD